MKRFTDIADQGVALAIARAFVTSRDLGEVFAIFRFLRLAGDFDSNHAGYLDGCHFADLDLYDSDCFAGEDFQACHDEAWQFLDRCDS